MRSTICVAEDRVSSEPSLKILLLSLTEHCPGTTVSLFYPVADDSFRAWLKRCPHVHLQAEPLRKGYGWNVKPQAVIRLLDAGFDEVIWIDSDVIVNRDFAAFFGALDTNVIAAGEDALGDVHDDPGALRARLWGFPVGRVLPFGLNSGVFRVTHLHRSLMARWWAVLQSDEYQAVQTRPWGQRPIHMMGDQDVLTAVLASREFCQVPLFILRRGKHILQFNGVWGYTVAERLKNLFGLRPFFIHSFAAKPWSDAWRPERLTNPREYLKSVYLDLSPYTVSASRFGRDLDCDTSWMQPHYMLSRILRLLGFGCAPLVGLPLAFCMDLIRLVARTPKSQSAAASNPKPSQSEAAN